MPTGSEVSDGPKLPYLDSSVVLHVVGNTSASAVEWFEERRLSSIPMVSSKLLALEVVRALRRDGLDPREADATFAAMTILNIDTELFDEAAAIEPHIKSLDALHLATCRRIGADYAMVATHDATMARVATELGFEVVDPVATP